MNNINTEKNHSSKIRQIDSLVLDVDGHCISAVAKECNCSRKFVKKCYITVKDNLEIVSNRHNSDQKNHRKISRITRRY